MKNFLFILTLLAGLLLFSSEKEINSDPISLSDKEVIMEEKNSADDIQHSLEILSSDLKGSNCLTPRRTAQTSVNTFDIRIQKNAEKILQIIRLKEANLLRKVSESVSICQTINRSALLVLTGYHVYALRKIII